MPPIDLLDPHDIVGVLLPAVRGTPSELDYGVPLLDWVESGCDDGKFRHQCTRSKYKVLAIRPNSAIALDKVVGFFPPSKVRITSEALTVPNFKDPAKRSRSSQLLAIREVFTRCRASPSRAPYSASGSIRSYTSFTNVCKTRTELITQQPKQTKDNIAVPCCISHNTISFLLSYTWFT